MGSRFLAVGLALAFSAHFTPAQSRRCFCNYRFGTSCLGYDLSSPRPWSVRRTGSLVAGPAPAASAHVFLLGLPLTTPIRNYLGANCTLYVQPVVTLPTVAASRFASLPFPVPNDRGLIGVELATQSAAVSATGPRYRLSNGWSVAVTTGAADTQQKIPPPYDTDYRCNDNVSGAQPARLGRFVAYHTRLPGRDFALNPRNDASTLHNISGTLADVVVNVPNAGYLEFGRGNSFRPVWVTGTSRNPFPEIVPIRGDGANGQPPDRINRYAYARIVHRSPTEVRVHWRYVPDFDDPTPTGVVHEIFTIRSTGEVTRRVHRSASTLEEAVTTAHNFQQNLTLQASGLRAGAVVPTTRTLPPGYTGTPRLATNSLTPRLWLPFDEGLNGKRTTRERISGKDARVEGRLANWHVGASGTALSFDGYTSGVSLPAADAPRLAGSFTVSAWVQLAAYPYGSVQVAGQARPHGHQSYVRDIVDGTIGVYTNTTPVAPLSVGGVGYMLGVDALGRPSLSGNFDGRWITCQPDFSTRERLPLNEWAHVVGVFDSETDEIKLYVGRRVNNVVTTREVAQIDAIGSLNIDSSVDFVVGKNHEPQFQIGGSETHGEAFARSLFGFEGLIDEVRVYDRALTRTEVEASVRAGHFGAKALPPRTLPTVSGSGFGARAATLSYHKAWDELFHDSGYDDVVVTFDNPEIKMAFWKGMSYGPAWIKRHDTRTNEYIWSHDQSAETGSPIGLVEHMSDKQVRYAHARIVEQTDARVVVHWRYAVPAVSYALAHEMMWVDEYYTVYPDGSCLRHVQRQFCDAIGWQGTYVLAPPGQRPMDVMHGTNICEVVDTTGTRVCRINAIGSYSSGTWVGVRDQPQTGIPAVIWTNTRSNYRLYRGLPSEVFVIYDGGLLGPWQRGSPDDARQLAAHYSPLATGNSFPVCQVPNDGRIALFNDRVSTSEGWAAADGEDDVMFYGFSTSSAAALPVVNSWNNPPRLSRASATGRFESRENAFRFDGVGSRLTFTLTASRSTLPMQGVAIVARDWSEQASNNPVVRVGGNVVSGARTGVHYNNGRRTLVVWLPLGGVAAAAVQIN